MRRSTPPRTAAPDHAAPKTGKVADVGRLAGAKLPTSKGTSSSKSLKEVKNWREVRKSDPQRSKEILVATKVAGRATDISIGLATGSIGGVYAGGFRGGYAQGNPWVHDSLGWRGWCNNGYSSWGSSFWWGSSWCGWSYAWYWSWYYPCWWSYTRPYYYSDYCYYAPVRTVVYSEPEVIYIERQGEPVGEVVVSAAPSNPAGRMVPAAANESPLSIAAQRYLELGDRAFREGRYMDAVQFYAKAVEFAPDRGALYLVLSDALFAAGDYHYGAYAIRRALEIEPELVETTIDKHAFYSEPLRFDEQLHALETYLGEHPGDRDARLVLALNLHFGGRPADAVRVIESASASMSEDFATQRILARAKMASQN